MPPRTADSHPSFWFEFRIRTTFSVSSPRAGASRNSKPGSAMNAFLAAGVAKFGSMVAALTWITPSGETNVGGITCDCSCQPSGNSKEKRRLPLVYFIISFSFGLRGYHECNRLGEGSMHGTNPHLMLPPTSSRHGIGRAHV